MTAFNRGNGPWFATLVGSQISAGYVQVVKDDESLAQFGCKLLLAEHIAGSNSVAIGNTTFPFLAKGDVTYRGQPVGVLVGPTRQALTDGLASLNWQEIPVDIQNDPKLAASLGHQFGQPSVQERGIPRRFSKQIQHFFDEELIITTATEHQSLPTDLYSTVRHGEIWIDLPSLNPDFVKFTLVRALGMADSKIHIAPQPYDHRLSDRILLGAQLACALALAVMTVKRPVILDPNLWQGFQVGTTFPHRVETELALRKDLRILRYRAKCWLNTGGVPGLSEVVAEDILAHAHGAYDIRHGSMAVHRCMTHLPPLEYKDGIGARLATLMIETAIANAGLKLGIPPEDIRRANLLTENEYLPFDYQAHRCRTVEAFQACEEKVQNQIKPSVESGEMKVCEATVPLTAISLAGSLRLQISRTSLELHEDSTLTVRTPLFSYPKIYRRRIVEAIKNQLHLKPSQILIKPSWVHRAAKAQPATADTHGRAVMHALANLKATIQEALAMKGAAWNDFALKGHEVVNLNEPLTDSYSIAELINLYGPLHTTNSMNDPATGQKFRPWFAYLEYGAVHARLMVNIQTGQVERGELIIVHEDGSLAGEAILEGEAIKPMFNQLTNSSWHPIINQLQMSIARPDGAAGIPKPEVQRVCLPFRGEPLGIANQKTTDIHALAHLAIPIALAQFNLWKTDD